jgi:ribonuclease BN (tRNA processing enzyme)
MGLSRRWYSSPLGGRRETVPSALYGVAVAVAVGCWGCAVEPPVTEVPDYSTGTHVVLLGTGTPNAEPDRSGPSLAVVANGSAYLVDAGPGVVRQAAAAAARGMVALVPGRLERVFLTHLHSDHTVGLPDLILTPWVLERERPLDVYGPTGTAVMTRHLLAAYEADVRRRIDGLQPQNATGHDVEVHEIAPGVVYRDTNVVVTAFAVQHEDWPEAYGFRFETSDRVIVISGDTRPTESVALACNGCDVLVHEVYSDAGFARRTPEWQRYHAHAHTSASQLASIARRARPRLLVLYHQLLWGSTPEELVRELQGGYAGPMEFGVDLDVF